MSITVGFWLPWAALYDVLERLPKDVEINFESDLWKRIKNPLKPDSQQKVIVAAIIFFLIIIGCIFYVFSKIWR